MEKETLVTIEQIQSQNACVRLCADFLVLYGLEGNTVVMSGKKQCELEMGGILTIVPFTHYSLLCSGENRAAVLHISQEMLQMRCINNQLSQIRCYIKDDSSGRHGEYDYIRMYLARAGRFYFQNSKQSYIQLFSDISQMLNILATYFTASDSAVHLQNAPSSFERFGRIMTYIHGHWREPLSIEQLARQEYISSGYLSRSFKAYTGMTFTDYLMELRLQNAANDLKSTTDTITKIAYANGFKNPNSFIKYFKASYGITPRQYRKADPKSNHDTWQTTENMSENDGLSGFFF